jgi:hypothetical protein
MTHPHRAPELRPPCAPVRGRKVMWENELLTPKQGEPVRFAETLAEVGRPAGAASARRTPRAARPGG